VRANQVKWDVATMCRILGVSPSGYYAWRNRPPSRRRIEDEKLTVAIKEWHARSRGTYGSPRILEDLREQGHRVGCKRVARLMRAAGLRGVCRRKWITTTIRDQRVRPAEDLVHRQFAATAPDQLWVVSGNPIITPCGN
jgi:putative transposase